MKISKKQKLEQFDELKAERDLLQRYFWDSRSGVLYRPDAAVVVEADGVLITLSVYRFFAAHGGYVVIEQKAHCKKIGIPQIEWWEKFADMVLRAEDVSNKYIAAVRLGVEQLRVRLQRRPEDAR